MSRMAFWTFLLLCSPPAHAQWKPPATRTVEVTDTYFGVEIKDPFRWLENLRDPEVKAWFKDQADLADQVLARIPGRDGLVREWTELDRLQPAAYSSISCESGRFFFKKTMAGENLGRLFCREGWDGPDTLLFDPAGYQPGASTAIRSLVPSCDGRYVAMGLTSGGAEYGEIRVLDVAHRTLLPDRIQASFGPIGWTPDSAAFFYDAGRTTDLRSLDVKLNRQTRLHQLAGGDREVFSSASNPELGIGARERPIAFIGRSLPGYLLGRVATVQNEMCAYIAPLAELDRPSIHWRRLCAPSDSLVRCLTFQGGMAYAVTHRDAPNGRVIRTSLAHPDWAHAETVVAEGKDTILGLTRSRDFFFIVASDGIKGRLLRYRPATGQVEPLALPAAGSVSVSCPDDHGNRCLVSINSWARPGTEYELDGDQGSFSPSRFGSAALAPGFSDLVAEEVEAPGHDGTRVPLSIIHRRDLPLDGSHSCILSGYGAYGSSWTPGFSMLQSVALRGVVVAYAHPRGGGEKGEAWYRAGFQTTKANTWKDFISCAEYLVKAGYTSPKHLGATGTSAGGILISRAVTERPELFAAAVCNVGCANALRLEFSANGPINTPEFGSVKDPEQFRALVEMDGVGHVRQGVRYPAILGVGGWNDPRVPPWQPGKFVAALQGAGAPALMKTNFNGGHFAEGKAAAYADLAGQVAFLLWQTGHRDFQLNP